MNTWNVLPAMVKADILERTRRTSFLVIVCLTFYLGYAVNSGQIFIKLESYRGIYNSAWVGSLMSLVITFFLGLAGFYLVKNAIDLDERTGVGQIIATTPLTRGQYLLGKWLSNFAVLSALVGILALSAILMQVIYREEAQIQLWALLAPFLFVALPMMALVAAFAVFFEAVRWLKGGFGNMVYFGVFMGLFMAGIFLTNMPWLDVSGLSLVGASMKAAAKEAFPSYGNALTLSMASDAPVQTFVWSGVSWTASLIFQRLMWLLVSVGLVIASTPFFYRFDPNSRPLGRQKQKPGEGPAVQAGSAAVASNLNVQRLTALPEPRGFKANFLRLVWLECLLLIKGLKWYWLAGMGLLWAGSILAEGAAERQMIFTLTGIWPVLVWSKMGEREHHCRAEQLIFQAAYPLVRLLAASWLAGVILTALAASGVLIGRLISGEPTGLVPWSLSILFIPTLAITLGIWSRSSKLFEFTYAILWYLGPFNRENGLVALDFLGIHAQAPVNTAPLIFTAVLMLLLLFALIGRRRQMAL